MHEVSLGGTLCDYLTGEARERTTYEDLRQALARYLVEERSFAPSCLRPRFAVSYTAAAGTQSREADLAMFSARGDLCLLLVFCPGQVHTYVREVTAMARLALPLPAPLAVVTDMREADLFAVVSGEILARGLGALPAQAQLEELAARHALPPLSPEQREKEGRILHAYTGFLKNCCGESCPIP
ncbi:type I restriction enzyme HsdR N-terminal domain-containing protein [Desulfovibrio sp. OttesenSCG-928-A18]|nr:type I restriction enzyme HsdR N-terminal domain-containing protein [Desulfovibrio sp. OttesenSCG-928-A18]